MTNSRRTNLYGRYMNASGAWHAHRKGCALCSSPSGPRCPDGDELWERLVRLQGAYLTHLRTRGTS
ncbi:hypothetical protein [Streptomyces sp. NPDC014623]|uniref:hypothetical protein n=1 Tax=Streptomyces sp. NPDC014623 TaxID=3364875 RepID=UPI0036F7D853